MKTIQKILIVLLIIGILIISGMEFLCRLGIKCKNCGRASASKEISIEEGYYLGEYEALTKKIKLKKHNHEVEFFDAWYENEWFINSDICLNRHKEIREGEYNVVFPFKKSQKDVFLFTMKPIINGKECKSCGGIEENQKKINISELPDTIEIQIHEGEIIVEKIKYVKK